MKVWMTKWGCHVSHIFTMRFHKFSQCVHCFITTSTHFASSHHILLEWIWGHPCKVHVDAMNPCKAHTNAKMTRDDRNKDRHNPSAINVFLPVWQVVTCLSWELYFRMKKLMRLPDHWLIWKLYWVLSKKGNEVEWTICQQREICYTNLVMKREE